MYVNTLSYSFSNSNIISKKAMPVLLFLVSWSRKIHTFQRLNIKAELINQCLCRLLLLLQRSLIMFIFQYFVVIMPV